jgi:hypothetical protein
MPAGPPPTTTQPVRPTIPTILFIVDRVERDVAHDTGAKVGPVEQNLAS